ncbi:MAG: MFS transporter [Shewanellaceae bacterium]|nr:MFS transporter [Shewanellaceae bacterium]
MLTSFSWTDLKCYLSSFSVYFHKRVLTLFFLGFSAGLPYMLVFSTFSFWLRKAGVERSTIGFMSWILLIYAFKWVWAPFVDRLALPFLSQHLGRRRSWLLLSQLCLMGSIAVISLSDPSTNLTQLAILAMMIAFSSATQDIVIDAFRIEIAPENMQAALSAAYMVGYRIAMIVAGAGSLFLVGSLQPENTYVLAAWQSTYLTMAGLMLIGIMTTLLCQEPDVNFATAQSQTKTLRTLLESKFPRQLANFLVWMYQSFIMPFKDFFERFGYLSWAILILISCYRISDIVLGVMANVFYVDMGFTEQEIAAIGKIYGPIMIILGSVIAGAILSRQSTLKVLLLGAFLSAITNLLFIVQSYLGHQTMFLTLVISIDNLSAGIALAAFVAYLSSLTSLGYSATQYALLSSIMIVLPKFVAGFSGVFVEYFGYEWFFFGTALLGIPVCLLIFWLMHQQKLQTRAVANATT